MDYGFLWNGYGFRILKNMDYGMNMDLVSNPSGPTGSVPSNDRPSGMPNGQWEALAGDWKK